MKIISKNLLFVCVLIFFVVVFSAAGCPMSQAQDHVVMEIQNDTDDVIHIQLVSRELIPLGAEKVLQPDGSVRVTSSNEGDFISVSDEDDSPWHYTAGGSDQVDITVESVVLVVNDTNGYWEN